MKVQFSDEAGRLVATPTGRLEAAEGAELAAAIAGRLGPATRSVVIDLEQLSGIGLGGLRAILRLAKSLKGQGKSLMLKHAAGDVRETLELAGLDEIFPFEPPHPSQGGTRNEHASP
jgi:anti-anti-sigma factor